ncbi:uncharacterized protein LOC141659936 [Apium graveolens]|uniref:uncharacterized protein LOC141659936 n=1 Tax=Apium graveolens TaxID=4045 RepID=UPI003D7977CE
MGFCGTWVDWMMLCVKTVTYNFCFNDSIIGPITPRKGLRQGDPLSPYLFLLYVEGLSNALDEASGNSSITGCKICPTAPSVTHLLFADDSFLFFQASVEKATNIKELLLSYETCSGQSVNFQKSGVYFSANVNNAKQDEISAILGVHNDLTKIKYLGLPSLVGRSKRRVFSYLKDKASRRIQSWIFKARYFPSTSILRANKGRKASFIWQGIWTTKGELCKGFIWVLGNGNEIVAAKDLWLRLKGDFHVEQSTFYEGRNELVSSFFYPNERKWNINMVQECFLEEDAKAILATHIPQRDIADKVFGTGSNNGVYTVKSGYHCWFNNHFGSVNVLQSIGWKRVWYLKIPPKVKVFIWRFCRNIIPVRRRLSARGLRVPITCTMCLSDIEHMAHLFFDCDFAVDCWRHVGLWYDWSEVENAHDWLLGKISSAPGEEVSKIYVVLWGVAARRTQVTFPTQASRVVQNTESKWQVPEPGWQFSMVDSVFEVELIGVRETLSWIKEGQYGSAKVLIESDSLLSIDAIQKDKINFLEVGEVIEECKCRSCLCYVTTNKSLTGYIMDLLINLPVIHVLLISKLDQIDTLIKAGKTSALGFGLMYSLQLKASDEEYKCGAGVICIYERGSLEFTLYSKKQVGSNRPEASY